MNLFGLGPMEIGLILVVVLILFGPKRLPQLGKSIGKTMKSSQDGINGKGEDEAPAAAKEVAATADDDEADSE